MDYMDHVDSGLAGSTPPRADDPVEENEAVGDGEDVDVVDREPAVGVHEISAASVSSCEVVEVEDAGAPVDMDLDRESATGIDSGYGYAISPSPPPSPVFFPNENDVPRPVVRAASWTGEENAPSAAGVDRANSSPATT
jgi:hypothetical protein